jgi:hypothetical protein
MTVGLPQSKHAHAHTTAIPDRPTHGLKIKKDPHPSPQKPSASRGHPHLNSASPHSKTILIRGSRELYSKPSPATNIPRTRPPLYTSTPLPNAFPSLNPHPHPDTAQGRSEPPAVTTMPLEQPPLPAHLRDVVCGVEDSSARGGWWAFQLKGLENQPLNSPTAREVRRRFGVVAVCDVGRVELGRCGQGDGGPDDRERRSFRVESWKPIVGAKIHASQKNQLHIPHYKEK